MLLTTIALASPAAAQSFTGEFRLLGLAGYTPEVSRAAGFEDPS